tara:strand:- start:49 stop:489 length:441 start_codon:yes stop_codon:yes gene_type:complete
MRAILINPKEEIIRVISYDGDYRSIYQILECRMFECVYPFKNEDTIYIDEEGLLKDSNYSFTIKCDDGTTIPLMGKGLILGTDAEGESIEHKTSLEDVKSRVTFKGKVAIEHGADGFTIIPWEKKLIDDEYHAKLMALHAKTEGSA